MLNQLATLYPVLQTLPNEAQRLLTDAQQMTVPAGTLLFDEQQSCQGFPFVLTGGIRVVKRSANGRELPLYRVLPGDSCIMTSSCLLGQVDYNASGITESDTDLVFLPKPAFDQLFAERIGELMQLVEEVAFQKLDQRLANLLLGREQIEILDPAGLRKLLASGSCLCNLGH